MCGIIAVARRPSTRPTPEASEILDPLAGLAAELRLGSDPTAALRDAADHLLATDALLRGVPGVRLLTADPTVAFNESLKFFNALRFNEKTAFMLAYPGEGHHLSKLGNRKDFTTRFFEFTKLNV